MTEEEWLAVSNPQTMIRYLIGTDAPRVQDLNAFPDCRTSWRKLRLFACASYYRISHILPDTRARAAVNIAERFTDGHAPRGELELAEAGVGALATALEEPWRASLGGERASLGRDYGALCLAWQVVQMHAPKAAYYAASNAQWASATIQNPGASEQDLNFGKCRLAEQAGQCELLRDIFGNPSRPANADPSWLTSTVVALARGIYDEKAFDRMPILADALQDAGCENGAVLNHCRGSGPHVRGCWVVDLLLGKA